MNAKTIATELPTTTTEQKPAAASAATATPQTVALASPSAAGPIKNAATPVFSTPTADITGAEGRSVIGRSAGTNAEEKRKTPTKMKIASSVYLRLSKQKDVTRKQIVEQFVAEAKLSSAGASTYYQLIKAKLS